MKRIVLALALCGSAVMAAPAHAAITFNVNGTFTTTAGGSTPVGTLAGTFTTNDALSAVTGYNLVASAAGTFTGYAYTPLTSSVTASVLPQQFFQLNSPGSVNELRLFFNSGLSASGGTFNPIASYEAEPSGGIRFLSGSVSAVTAAVPEAGTWAMMIAGVGMVGGAMRRRKAEGRTTVSFA